MKPKHLLFVLVLFIITAHAGFAQNTKVVKPSIQDRIPFGKKLPPPDVEKNEDKNLLQAKPVQANPDFKRRITKAAIIEARKNPESLRQLLKTMREKPTQTFFAKSQNNYHPKHPKKAESCDLQLTKDINALTGSYPRNLMDNSMDLFGNYAYDSIPFAELNGVVYFVVNYVVNSAYWGDELWRSDGTVQGTYMVKKEIEPGMPFLMILNITALNGKIYFIAYTMDYLIKPFVSDGTEQGTRILKELVPGGGSAYPNSFFSMGKDVYFISDGNSYASSFWKTDGTEDGTARVLDIYDLGTGSDQIIQPTVVNNLLYFTCINYERGEWQLWRTDFTNAGTFQVSPNFPMTEVNGNLQYSIPAQLTKFNNKLYFSADDGTGRKLWVSDGSIEGTGIVPGNPELRINADYLGMSFPLMNNSLFIPGGEASKGSGLYKFDGKTGIVRIKDLAPMGVGASIVPKEMVVVNGTLYFKVINNSGGVHEELWSSKGTNSSTRLIYKLKKDETLTNLYNGNGILYFVKYDKVLGTELWRIFDTFFFGAFPIPVSDIFRGPTSSYPNYLTALKGKLIFSATDEKRGNELFVTGGNAFNTTVVKDINTEYSEESKAGYNAYGYQGIVGLGKDVIFSAYENVHGSELYISDGTAMGTKLFREVIPGEDGLTFKKIISKNDDVYFLGINADKYSLYKADRKKNGVSRITNDFTYIGEFMFADNGLMFYVTYNPDTYAYELWRTDGSKNGTLLLSSSLYGNFLNVSGNTAFFVAGDDTHGYELWKSDGSIVGTKMVKDINPGAGSSTPFGMVIYNNAVYFSAYATDYATPSFWKSDGTDAGTFMLKDIDIWYSSNTEENKHYFCVFNNILYFSAVDYAANNGTLLWRTDGTVAGTLPIKDFNPASSDLWVACPVQLTLSNGSMFFGVHDGINGEELWKSDGSTEGTQLVKVITPAEMRGDLWKFTSFGGKLFLINGQFNEEDNGYHHLLWTSDGTEEGTNEVEIPDVINVYELFAGQEKLFLGGYSYKYGSELYAGEMCAQTGKLDISRVASQKFGKTGSDFDAVVYPNPAVSNTTLQLSGNTESVTVTISDLSGRKLWQSQNNHTSTLNLPTEKLHPGTYIINISNGAETKAVKLIKQ